MEDHHFEWRKSIILRSMTWHDLPLYVECTTILNGQMPSFFVSESAIFQFTMLNVECLEGSSKRDWTVDIACLKIVKQPQAKPADFAMFVAVPMMWNHQLIHGSSYDRVSTIQGGAGLPYIQNPQYPTWKDTAMVYS